MNNINRPNNNYYNYKSVNFYYCEVFILVVLLIISNNNVNARPSSELSTQYYCPDLTPQKSLSLEQVCI